MEIKALVDYNLSLARLEKAVGSSLQNRNITSLDFTDKLSRATFRLFSRAECVKISAWKSPPSSSRFNEEKRLEAALKSVQGLVSEIVVVDSRSTDETVRIAKDTPTRSSSGSGRTSPTRRTSPTPRRPIPGSCPSTPTSASRPSSRGDPRPRPRGARLRRLLHPPPGLLSRPLDPPLRLVSGPEGPALPPGPGPLGGRLRPREPRLRRPDREAQRARSITSPTTASPTMWPASTSSRDLGAQKLYAKGRNAGSSTSSAGPPAGSSSPTSSSSGSSTGSRARHLRPQRLLRLHPLRQAAGDLEKRREN